MVGWIDIIEIMNSTVTHYSNDISGHGYWHIVKGGTETIIHPINLVLKSTCPNISDNLPIYLRYRVLDRAFSEPVNEEITFKF